MIVYRRIELVLVMKRVKSQAMFPPSWKFKGKPNSILLQFFCFVVFRGFQGGLHFRGDLRFRGLRSSFSRHPSATTRKIDSVNCVYLPSFSMLLSVNVSRLLQIPVKNYFVFGYSSLSVNMLLSLLQTIAHAS